MLKRMIHKHKYTPWANVYGDLIDQLNGSRTVCLCTVCGKRKYKKEHIEAPINYNNLVNYWMLYRLNSNMADRYLKNHLDDIIENKQDYITSFVRIKELRGKK